MRFHFWLILVLSASLALLCGWQVMQFPERQHGTSVALQYQRLRVWTELACAAGVYVALAACVLTHAWAGRWRFWATVVCSAVFLWVCGGGLFVLIVDESPAATPRAIAQMGFALFIESVAAVLYAAVLLTLWAASGLASPVPSSGAETVSCPACGGSGRVPITTLNPSPQPTPPQAVLP